MNKNTSHRLILGIPLIVLVLFLWEILSRWGIIDTILLPPPTIIILRFSTVIFISGFWVDLSATVFRFLWGYFIGCFIAIPLGVALGLSNRIYNSMELLLESLRPIPASALLPIGILLFGLGDLMTIMIIIYAVTWPVLVNTIDGVRSVDTQLIDTGRVFGLSRWSIAFRIIIPSATPAIITGMRVSLALSITLVIVVEMLVGNKGLGHRIIDAERTFRFAEMYGLIGMIGLLGYCTNRAFIWITDALVAWHRNVYRELQI